MHPSFLRGKGGAWNGWILRFGRHAALRVPGFRRAGESALHERDHRGGDHPIPFRTRQLSPPSPKVLQRQAAGGQGAALMQGASAFHRAFRPFSFLGGRGPLSSFLGKNPDGPSTCQMLVAFSRSRFAWASASSLGSVPPAPGSRPPSLEPAKRYEHLTGLCFLLGGFSGYVSCAVSYERIHSGVIAPISLPGKS